MRTPILAVILGGVSLLPSAVAQPPAPVRPGIEVFLANVPSALRGKRVALLTNHSAVDRARTPDIDLIAQHQHLKLVALLAHAFDTLGCQVVGLRTDNFNFRSQRAIEALGAKKDGVLRHHAMRRDGSVRDSVLYSILAGEWPDVRKHLELRLNRHREE